MEVEKVTLCATKAGKGYKIAVNGEWFYTSKKSLIEFLIGEADSCVFSTYKENDSSAE